MPVLGGANPRLGSSAGHRAEPISQLRILGQTPQRGGHRFHVSLHEQATDAVQIFNGNLKAKPTNAIIEEVNNLVAEAKPRSIVRWWEAVPADLQGDLVAQMGAFMLNPTADNATKVMNDMESLNADYWASR